MSMIRKSSRKRDAPKFSVTELMNTSVDDDEDLVPVSEVPPKKKKISTPQVNKQEREFTESEATNVEYSLSEGAPKRPTLPESPEEPVPKISITLAQCPFVQRYKPRQQTEKPKIKEPKRSTPGRPKKSPVKQAEVVTDIPENAQLYIDPKYVQCKECLKIIKLQSFRQHWSTHLDSKNRYPCDLCEKTFTRRGDVTRHKINKHINEKRLPCSMCPRKFLDEKTLRAHQENHGQPVFFVCPTCNWKFTKKKYYDGHIKFIHPQKSPEEAASDTLKEEEPDNNQIIILSAEEFSELEQHNDFASSELSTEDISIHNDGNGRLIVIQQQGDDTDDKSSSDAVQTLIDAVQELIQTHYEEGRIVIREEENMQLVNSDREKNEVIFQVMDDEVN